MKDNFIRDLEVKLLLNGMDQDEIEKVIRCAIACLDNYDMTERITDITVRHEDINERILKRYVACLRLDGKSEKTIKQYVFIIGKFSESTKSPFTEVTTNEIRYYLSTMMIDRKKSYVKYIRNCLSGFFRWMKEECLITQNPCARINDIKCEQEVRLPFSAVEIDKMRSVVGGRYALRNRAIFEVLLSSGVRCDELCNLNRGDVDLKAGSLIVRKGKGGKGRTTYISEVAAEYLERYLEGRNDESESMFVSACGKFTNYGIEKAMKNIGRSAHVENVHPHRFRRTFATSAYRRGMDIEEIRRLMGHTDVKTTLRYIYTDDSQLRAAYKKYAA